MFATLCVCPCCSSRLGHPRFLPFQILPAFQHPPQMLRSFLKLSQLLSPSLKDPFLWICPALSWRCGLVVQWLVSMCKPWTRSPEQQNGRGGWTWNTFIINKCWPSTLNNCTMCIDLYKQITHFVGALRSQNKPSFQSSPKFYHRVRKQVPPGKVLSHIHSDDNTFSASSVPHGEQWYLFWGFKALFTK